ncbi:unnamed protein product [Moneuplotes crassus]|uniref:Uncharacterized protein n=1 Tax=Euplotes crassus TaxID=5936 RepID=A0AAD2CV63_EUPCR|nr:unnamed protein product [Moneuplotes crassus]
MEDFANHDRFVPNVTPDLASMRTLKESQSDIVLPNGKKANNFNCEIFQNDCNGKNKGKYNKVDHNHPRRTDLIDPLDAVVDGFKKKRSNYNKRVGHYSSARNISHGGSSVQKCRITKGKGKKLSSQNLSSKRKRSSQKMSQANKPHSTKASFVDKKCVQGISTDMYTKDISVESRNTNRFKANKLKQSIEVFNSVGFSTSQSKASGTPMTQMQSYAEKEDLRRGPNKGRRHRSHARNKNSINPAEEETSNLRSSERNSAIRNIQMDGFWVHKNDQKEGYPPKSPSESKTSLFAFLQKLEGKGFKDRLERGYLLLDRKNRIIPSYKSEIKNEQSSVIAFWISGSKYPNPNSLDKDLLKKVKFKLSLKIGKNSYLCALCVEKYCKLMNSRPERLHISDNCQIEAFSQEVSHSEEANNRENSEITDSPHKGIYIFTCMRRDFIKNVCAYCKTFSEEPIPKVRKRSSSRRSRSRSKRDRKSSKRGHELRSSKQALVSDQNTKCKDKSGMGRKTSFGQAVIKDHANKENIPSNMLRKQQKSSRNSAVYNKKSNSNGKSFAMLHEVINKKPKHSNNNDPDSKNHAKARSIASCQKKAPDAPFVTLNVQNSDCYDGKTETRGNSSSNRQRQVVLNTERFEEFSELKLKKSQSEADCIRNQDLASIQSYCTPYGFKGEVDQNELLNLDNQNHLVNIYHSLSTPNSQNTVETTIDRNVDSTYSDMPSREYKRLSGGIKSIISPSAHTEKAYKLKSQRQNDKNPITGLKKAESQKDVYENRKKCKRKKIKTGSIINTDRCANEDLFTSLNSKHNEDGNYNFFSDSKPPTKRHCEVVQKEIKYKRKDPGNHNCKGVKKLNIIHLKQKHARKSSKGDSSKFYKKYKKRKLQNERSSSVRTLKDSEGSKPTLKRHSSRNSSRLSNKAGPSMPYSAKNKHCDEKKEIIIGHEQRFMIDNMNLQSLGSISIIKNSDCSSHLKNLKQAMESSEDYISDVIEDSNKALRELGDVKDLEFGCNMSSCTSAMSDSSTFLMINPLDEKTNAYGFDTLHKGTSDLKEEEWTMTIPKMRVLEEK